MTQLGMLFFILFFFYGWRWPLSPLLSKQVPRKSTVETCPNRLFPKVTPSPVGKQRGCPSPAPAADFTIAQLKLIDSDSP